MRRGELALVIWLSIQLLFVSAFSMIMFRLWQLTTILKNRTFILLFIADVVAVFAEEWGAEAPEMREKLLPRVRKYREMAARVKPGAIGQMPSSEQQGPA